MSQNHLGKINGVVYPNFESQCEIGMHIRTMPESKRVIPQKELNKMKKNSLDANASIYDDMCWGQSGSNVANIWQSVDGFGGSSRGNRGFGKNRADLNDFNPN